MEVNPFMSTAWNKVVLVFSIALAGCTTGELTPQIREGMTKQEVVSILGNPDSFQRSGEYEGLRYTHRFISGWSWDIDRTDFSVILKDGRVVEYGATPPCDSDRRRTVIVRCL